MRVPGTLLTESLSVNGYYSRNSLGGHVKTPMHSATQVKPISAVSSRPAGAVVPLSSNQEQLWLYYLTNPQSTAYNESITIVKKGSFQIALFEDSLNEFIKRHEILRANVQIDGTLIVHDQLVVNLFLVDLSHLAQNDKDAEALKIAAANAGKAFVLESGPLFRISIVRINDWEHRCFLTVHHIVSDGISLSRILLPELVSLYEAMKLEKLPDLVSPLSNTATMPIGIKTRSKCQKGIAALRTG